MGTSSVATASVPLILIFFVPHVHAQNASSSFHPFGLNVSASTTQLWIEVTSGYGHEIREEADLESLDMVGFSDVGWDGIPFISLSSKGRSEDYLVHELMHLKLRLEGYPHQIRWTSNCLTDGPLEMWLSRNLKDSIEHWIFYPRVLAMGLIPDAELAKDMRRAIQMNSPEDDTLSVDQLAFEYFRALILPNQTDLGDEFRAWYRKRGWAQALKIADRMFGILTSLRPNTPRAEITVFVDCANVLLSERRHVEETGWSVLRIGDLQLQGVDIAMTSLVPCAP